MKTSDSDCKHLDVERVLVSPSALDAHTIMRYIKSTCCNLPVIKFSRNSVPAPVFGVPPPEIAVPPPKVVVPPPGNVFVVHTVFFGQLILRKIMTCYHQMSDFNA